MTPPGLFKQPHEDIPLVPYADDPLLSLEGPAVAYRELLMVMTCHLHSAALCGTIPHLREIYDRMRNPTVGDLVVETGTRLYHSRPGPDERRLGAFGRLILHRKEWWDTDEEWQARADDDDRRTDMAWYVQFGPNHIFRWVNCTFIAVPASFGVFDPPSIRRPW